MTNLLSILTTGSAHYSQVVFGMNQSVKKNKRNVEIHVLTICKVPVQYKLLPGLSPLLFYSNLVFLRYGDVYVLSNQLYDT